MGWGVRFAEGVWGSLSYRTVLRRGLETFTGRTLPQDAFPQTRPPLALRGSSLPQGGVGVTPGPFLGRLSHVLKTHVSVPDLALPSSQAEACLFAYRNAQYRCCKLRTI